MEVRMSLADAAALLNTAPNTIRSRFKAGKIRGERDNSGKIWVWIDTENSTSKQKDSKHSKDSRSKVSNVALELLSAELETAQKELQELRPKVAKVERLEAEKSLLLEQVSDLKADRDAWRQMAQRKRSWNPFKRNA